jgi:hypothetical protein
LWKCGDSLFFKVLPLVSDTLLAMLHPFLKKHAADCCLLQNFLPWNSLFMVGKVQKSHGERSELNSVFSLENVDQWNSTGTPGIQSRSCFVQFLGFSNHEKGAPRQEISKWSAACFQEVGGAL